MEPKTVGRTSTQQMLRGHGRIPTRGLIAGTIVLTADGEIPVEYINPGDRIVTRNSGMVRLSDVSCRLARVSMVAVQPGALGTGIPQTAAILPADQSVLLRDWRAEALYGQKAAIVPVQELDDGETIRVIGVRTTSLIQLHFDTPQIVYADGIEVALASTTGVMAKAA